jgi:hypothetical protein
MKCPVVLAVSLVLPGCTAVGAVTNIATAPVRAATTAVSAGSTLVDATTTSQSERDERRGRELRQREERLGELDRAYRRQASACDQGNEAACAQSKTTWHEIQTLNSSQPYPEE